VRILTVVGARPQFVKAAPVSRSLRRSHEEILVHTGQHYDDAMSALFFRELEIPEPNLNLEVGSGSHAVMTAEILRRLEPVMLEHRPDGVLVYGDTNSTLAAAIVASKVAYEDGIRPWLAHVEAGLRSTWPCPRNATVWWRTTWRTCCSLRPRPPCGTSSAKDWATARSRLET
jgi:UDP-N-acetylglucosamine 2-epimerase